jgi:hypothetical protein
MAICLLAALAAASSQVAINSGQVLLIDRQKVCPVGFTTPPPPDGQTLVRTFRGARL